MRLFGRSVALLNVGLALTQGELVSQKPLAGADDDQSDSPQWRLNFSSTAPYLFSSVSSLLQQWGNTMFPNGHNIVPCEIPPYTLFYHGRQDAETPPSPEWLAFDIEMSYGIMGSTRSSFMFTYQTTRPVKALYFDGESAALSGMGQLDTQMLHVFGNLSGPPNEGWGPGLFGEYQRATGLCDWLADAGLRGDGWGYEGIIRMNAGFEMIWCNFTSPSLRLLSQLNVTAPQLPKEEDDNDEERDERLKKREEGTSYYPLPPIPTRTDHSTDPTNPARPPNWRWEVDREPFLRSQAWGWFSSATYHYGASRNGPGIGEARARVLNCGILSYYSPSFSNLTLMRAEHERTLYNLTSDGYWEGQGTSGNRTTALAELRRRRRYHILENATSEDAALMRADSERVLKNLLETQNNCTGADWTYITHEITQVTTLQMKELAKALDTYETSASNYTTLKNWISTVRMQSHMFYVSFLEYPQKIDLSGWAVGSRLYRDTYSRCRYRYTRLMAPSEGTFLTPEEDDLRWAVEEVYGSICSALLTIGFQVETIWNEHFNNIDTEVEAEVIRAESAIQIEKHLAQQATEWSDSLSQLMAWLGWEDQFISCSEVCAWDERCYIPIWPFMSFGGGRPRPPRGPPPNDTSPRFPPGDGKRPDGHHGEPPGHGPGHGPGGRRPGGRDPGGFMGDEGALWEPKCVKMDYFFK